MELTYNGYRYKSTHISEFEVMDRCIFSLKNILYGLPYTIKGGFLSYVVKKTNQFFDLE